MGSNVSALSELTGPVRNPLLERFCSTEPLASVANLDETETYWVNLLSHRICPPVTSRSSRDFEESLALPYLAHLAVNNRSSGNLNALLRRIVRLTDELDEAVLQPLTDRQRRTNHLNQLAAALFLARYCIKYLLESENERSLLEHMEFCPIEDADDQEDNASVIEKKSSSSEGSKDSQNSDEEGAEEEDSSSAAPSSVAAESSTTIEDFVESLVKLVILLPADEDAFSALLEATNNLLVLLSLRMYHGCRSSSQLAFYQILCSGRCAPYAKKLTASLVQRFVSSPTAPDRLLVSAPQVPSQVYSAAATLATGLWYMVTLGYGGGSGGSSSGSGGTSAASKNEEPTRSELKRSLMSRQSLLLCLALALSPGYSSTEEDLDTPYRDTLLECDAKLLGNYATLLGAIGSNLPQDEALLLLYLLLHPAGSHALRNHLASAGAGHPQLLAALVLPLLQCIHSASTELQSHRLYMAMIDLLMLTEQPDLCRTLHSAPLPGGASPAWLAERQLGPQGTIGSLLVVVLARCVQLNLHKLGKGGGGGYLPSNCLAALANQSTQARSLHPYACQKLLGLLPLIATRLEKLELQQQQQQSKQKQRKSPTSSSTASDEAAALESACRSVLEAVNGTLSRVSLSANPHLVYTLLHQRSTLFSKRLLQTRPELAELAFNLQTVSQHFAGAVARDAAADAAGVAAQQQQQQQQRLAGDPGDAVALPPPSQLSEARIMQVITSSCPSFKRDRLRQFPEPRFKYVEEAKPDDFFVPYIWALVYKHSGLYFNPSRITLLRPPSAAASSGESAGASAAAAAAAPPADASATPAAAAAVASTSTSSHSMETTIV